MSMMQMMMRSGGSSVFTPVGRIYQSGSSATETAPAGCSNVEIRIIGSGGRGGNGKSLWPDAQGGGGGGGGYSASSYAIVGGQTLKYTFSSGTGSVSSGTKSITTMTANVGKNGNNAARFGGTGGAGGTATGGNVANITGETGQTGFETDGGEGGYANGQFKSDQSINGMGGLGVYWPETGVDGIYGGIEFYYT